MNRKTAIIAIILLAFAIVIVVVFSQKPQDNRQRAAGTAGNTTYAPTCIIPTPSGPTPVGCHTKPICPAHCALDANGTCQGKLVLICPKGRHVN